MQRHGVALSRCKRLAVSLGLFGLLMGAPAPLLAAPLAGFPLLSSQVSPVTGAVTISAPAVTPEAGLLGVQFKVDGYVLDALDTTSPFQVVWSAASATNGDHRITAEVQLASGVMIESAPLLLTVANPTTFNRTLHVDAAAGNDANNGLTPGTAWLTLGRANSAAIAGDTVRLRGTFTGQLLQPVGTANGTSSAPLIYESDAGQTAVIDGGSGGRAIILTGRSFITIRNIRVQNVNVGYSHAIVLQDSNDNVIDGNTILNVGSAGPDASDSIFVQNSSRNRITNNTIQNGGHSLILMSNQNATSFSSDNVIADNVLINQWGTGIALLFRSQRTIVERNVIRDINLNNTNNTSAAIQLVSSDNVIRYNTMRDNHSPGISIFAYVYSGNGVPQDAIGNQIYHNVFYGSLANGSTGQASSIWIFEKDSRSVANNLIANNIFYRNAGFAFGGSTYTIGIDHYNNPTAWPAGSLNGNQIKNNIVLRQPGTAGEVSVLRIRNASQGGNLSYTLPQFQATHPDAANNLQVDPLFTDEASRLFSLRAGSPAIDRGFLIPGVVYLGTAPDLGAFEFDGGGGTLPAAPSGLSLQ